MKEEINIGGESHTLSTWCEIINIPVAIAKVKLEKESLEKIITSKFSSLVYKGIEHSIIEWSILYGIKLSSLIARLNQGLTIEQALTLVSEKRERLITYKGRTQSLVAWCNELNIPYATAKSRLNRLHWSITDTFEKPYVGFYWCRGEKND